MIEEFIKKIPDKLLNKSGAVFYSGKSAFSSKFGIYILGINPGGNPDSLKDITVSWHTEQVLKSKPDRWSEYSHESWHGAKPGTRGMQPRVLHLIKNTGYKPECTPASNLVFLRSRRESDIKSDLSNLANDCWHFHQAVIEELQPKVIICFGKTVGTFVSKKINADTFVDEFIENNNRRWRNFAKVTKNGTIVVTATHPSIADWTAPNTDPTPMITKLLTS